MSKQVILLRGINVGGKGKLPMADLQEHLEALGADGAKTHLQSGNAVCPRPVDIDALAGRIEAAQGFRPTIMAIEDWAVRMATNPFPVETPKALHGFFHDGPSLDTSEMPSHMTATEALHSAPGVIWLHTPDGFGRSKIASRLERLAGRPLTARNWNTVAAISALLEP